MRIYEFAKKNGLSSKEVLDLLKSGGHEASSHMSVLSEDGLAYLNNKFAKKDSSSPKSKSLKKVETKKTLKVPVKKIKEEVKAKPVEAKIDIKPAPDKSRVKVFSKQSNKTKQRRPGKNNFERELVTEITLTDGMPLFEAANLMGKTDGDLIFALLRKGMACNRNYVLPVDAVKDLADGFGITANIVQKEEVLNKFLSKSKKAKTRWPIVVVMGHVDHGKTTLLDFLRKKNVAAGEKGGITQHLGAYEVDSKHGKIVFLDTPGHEAFSYVRSRGTSVTDIAILMIAAEDGIKPQTIEAIKYARQSKVPIVVAINKIDKIPAEKLETVLQGIKRELAQHDLLVEDWGGDVICVPISAQSGKGVDELLEMVVLQADMLDLKADPSLPAHAFILESNIEKGLGPIATVIPLEGTLKQGDYFVCGASTGKVRLLIDSAGEKIKEAGPSIPVKVVGFDNFAEIGAWLNVVSAKEYKKSKTSKKSFIPRTSYRKEIPFDLADQDKKTINLIIKTDTNGSKEAIEGSLAKLSGLTEKDCSLLSIISSGIGGITETDIENASTVGAIVLGLHAKVDRKASSLAQEKKVEIKTFDVIYHLVEYLEEILKKTKKIEIKWVPAAKLLVKKVFDIKKLGVIAGCSVQEGTVSSGDKVVCIRGRNTLGEGIIKSLQKERKVVKTVKAGYECGFISDGFQGWAEGDLVDVFTKETVSSD